MMSTKKSNSSSTSRRRRLLSSGSVLAATATLLVVRTSHGFVGPQHTSNTGRIGFGTVNDALLGQQEQQLQGRASISGTSKPTSFATTCGSSYSTAGSSFSSFVNCNLFKGNGQYPPSMNNRHSSNDWLYNIQSIPQSTILREVRNPVQMIGGWSLLVSLAYRLMSRCPTGGFFSTLASHMTIPGTAHSFLVSALGLLLVFRTNSAYQRFLEGRKIWEEILSLSRNISRMVTLYSAEVGNQRKRRIMHMLAAYPYLLRHHIRTGCLCGEKDAIPDEFRLKLHEPALTKIETRYEGDHLVSGASTRASSASASTNDEDITAFKTRSCWVDRRNLPWRLFDSMTLTKLARSHNRPLWACDRIGREVMSIPYGPNFTSRERLSLLGQVEKLTNAIGQCERIHQTAVPLNYARHSLRSLSIWLLTLPFALVKDVGLLTPVVTAISAWVLFGVYQIGYSIEDPFQGSLRLSILCDSIRRDVLGTISEDDVSTFANRRESAYTVDSYNDMWDAPEEDNSYYGRQEAEVKSKRKVDTTAEILADVLSHPPFEFQKKTNGTWEIVAAESTASVTTPANC